MAKILIIEDNPTNMKLTAMLLARVGHQVLQAVDAETGMALAQSDHPELILMDLDMPRLNGYQATQAIRIWEAQHGQKRRAIIACTAPLIAGVGIPMPNASLRA